MTKFPKTPKGIFLSRDSRKEEGREEWAWERGGKEKEKGRERREKGKVQGDSEGGKQRKDEREGRVTIFFPAAYLVFTVPATTSVQLKLRNLSDSQLCSLALLCVSLH